MTDRDDAVVVTYRPRGRRAYRHVFEPRQDETFLRVEETLAHDDTWREIGSDIVSDLSIEDDRDD